MNIQRSIEPPSGGSSDYETDFLAWTTAQANALRTRDLSRIDWDNLIEEVESLGRSERKELMSRITVILVHLLKYEFGVDPNPRGKWRTTLIAQRHELSDLLDANPSLVREVQEVMERKYLPARTEALSSFDEHEPNRTQHYAETLPRTLPYTPERVLEDGWFPDVKDAE